MALIHIERKHNPELSLNDAKFAPKLSFRDRCLALCFRIEGSSWPAIASYFGVHRRTVEMIEKGPAYRSVRDDFERMGQERFLVEYLDAERYRQFTEFLAKWRSGDPEVSNTRQSADPEKPNWWANKQANAKEDRHRVRDTGTGDPRVVDVIWRAATSIYKPGWYYSVDDTFGDRPYATSQEAFDASKRVWNYGNSGEAKEIERRLAEREVLASQAKRRAAHAREAMMLTPSIEAVSAFVHCASEAMKIQGVPAVDIEYTVKDRGWWAEEVMFDPTPFGYEIGEA